MRIEEKVLLTDIDGVIAASAKPVIEEVNLRFGLRLRVKDINDWHYVSRTVERITGNRELGRAAEQIWFEPKIIALAEPIDGAQEAIDELVNVWSWQVWAATSRLPSSQEVTMAWVGSLFPDIIKSGGVYIRQPGNEEIINGPEIKLAAVGMLQPDVYVEDDQNAIRHVVTNYPFKKRLTVAMLSWELNADAGSEFEKYRVANWAEILGKAKSGR